jgi:hypothetical protein
MRLNLLAWILAKLSLSFIGHLNGILENAIEKTAIWYKACFEDGDILKISTEQIEEYY